MSEHYLRVFANYFVQGLWAVVLAILLWYFFARFKRNFLQIWSLSWCSYAVYCLFAAISLFNTSTFPLDHPFRITVSSLSLVSAYYQVILLLWGAYELIHNRRPNSNKLLAILIIAMIVSILSSLLFIHDPSAVDQRIFVRVGLKVAFTALAFIICGIWISFSTRGIKSIGKNILIISFLVFGIEQFIYFMLGFSNLFEASLFLQYFVYSNLMSYLLHSLMAVGMITWLLENESLALEKTNQELDSFLFKTSHNMQAPITSIKGLTNLAKKEVKDEVALNYFKMIEEKVSNFGETVQDIITFSKVKSVDPTYEIVNVSKLIRNLRNNLIFNKGETTINFNFHSPKEIVINTDESKLKIILNILIQNAIKYHDISKEDLFIKVDVIPNDQETIITVEDNGQGIDEKNLPKIFDRFFRAHNQSDGTGLGLFIVKETVATLQGNITVQSSLGEGSTFTVIIPTPKII